jgi:hypothetical protein
MDLFLESAMNVLLRKGIVWMAPERIPSLLNLTSPRCFSAKKAAPHKGAPAISDRESEPTRDPRTGHAFPAKSIGGKCIALTVIVEVPNVLADYDF